MNQPILTIRHSASLLIVLLALTLALSACGGSAEADLTLYPGGRFQAEIQVTVPAIMTADLGPGVLDSRLREVEEQLKAENMTFSWRKGKSQNPDQAVYNISIGGQSYDSLDSVFSIAVEETNYQGQDALLITARPNRDLSDADSTIRLHVGKVLKTSNQVLGNNTVVWSGAESLEAIVTPASSMSWSAILLLILIVVAAGAAYIVLRRRPARQAVSVAPPAPEVQPGRFCPHCGQPTQPGAKFCMHCGQSILPR